jgi:pseudouridine-5'-phosphate glycosidase
MPTLHRRSIHRAIVYGDEIATARRNGLPIVALESTIITHGMPYPDNLNTALRVEDTIRKQVCTITRVFQLIASIIIASDDRTRCGKVF